MPNPKILCQIIIHLNQLLEVQHHVQLSYRPLVTYNIIPTTYIIQI